MQNVTLTFKLHLTFDTTEAYSEPNQRSKMELLAEILDEFQIIAV